MATEDMAARSAREPVARALTGGELMASIRNRPSTSPVSVEDRAELSRRRDLLRAAGIPERHMLAIRAGLTVDSWSEESQPGVERAIATVRDGGMVCLLGPRGTGKTQLAAWLAHGCCMSMGRSALYRRWSDLLGELRHGAYTEGESEAKLVDHIARLGLLVLDELHESRGTEDEALWMGRIIDRRYGSMKPTVLVANLTPEAMAKAIGPSAWDRMCECGAVVELRGQSFRVKR